MLIIQGMCCQNCLLGRNWAVAPKVWVGGYIRIIWVNQPTSGSRSCCHVPAIPDVGATSYVMGGNKASIHSVATSALVQQLLLLFIFIRGQTTSPLTLDPAWNCKDTVTRPSPRGKVVGSWEKRPGISQRNSSAARLLVIVLGVEGEQ